MQTIYLVFYGVLGLIIGSFLNVVIFRIPARQSILTPRSHCPNCEHYLRSWELIPVVSYLLLEGRCNNCKQKISWRYPAIEMLTGILFVLAFVLRPDRDMTGLLMDMAFISLLVALAFIDIDTFSLPDNLVIIVAVLGVANTLFTGDPTLKQSILGAVIAGGVFFLIFKLYPKGMGMGDVKFVAAMGLYLGAPIIIASVLLASLSGVIFGGLWLILKKKNLRTPVPFGPFLAAGALLVLFIQY